MLAQAMVGPAGRTGSRRSAVVNSLLVPPGSLVPRVVTPVARGIGIECVLCWDRRRHGRLRAGCISAINFGRLWILTMLGECPCRERST